MKLTNNFLYKDKPLFGLDIGTDSLRVMQLDTAGPKLSVVGYGTATFNPGAFTDGVITQPELIAEAAVKLFQHHIVGKITTRRVALAIPASRTYNRAIKLPTLGEKEIADAVRTEAEQYIPIPLDQLYLDYTIIRKQEKEVELFAVAAPKALVDSYLQLGKLLGLDVVTAETTIEAVARLFSRTDHNNVPTVLIDFGSTSAEITIFDSSLIVTGTVGSGGDHFTNSISDKLGVNKLEAIIIKTRYGLDLSKKQKEIKEAVSPVIEELLKEVRRMVRYYHERYGDTIGQIVIMGHGANMPGLTGHLTAALRLPVRTSDPWKSLDFSHVHPPDSEARPLYATVAGLALIDPKELFT